MAFGSIGLDITGNTAGLQQDITKGIGGAFKKLAGVAAAAGLGLGFKSLIDGARESAKIMRLTENVIRSTGGAAGITAAQVGDLATSISNLTGADDEAIQSGSNLLLTFTGVRNEVGKGNDIFNQATKAAVDMAAGLNNGDTSAQAIKTTALQLGKALNDPTKGMAALSRSGVSFTAQQKDQIKTLQASGDVLGAQKIILAELQKEFGGAAAAAADPLTRLQTIAGNLGEDIGALLLPTVDRFATLISGTVVPAITDFLPKVQEVAGEIRDFLAPSVGRLVEAFQGALPGIRDMATSLAPAFAPLAATLPVLIDGLAILFDGLGKIGEFFASHSTIVGTFATVIGTLAVGFGLLSAAVAIGTAVTGGLVTIFWALNAAMAANPVGIIVLAVAALTAGFIYAWKESETFRNIVVSVFNTVKDAVLTGVEIMFKAFTFFIRGVLNGISGLAGAWTNLPEFLGGGDNGWASKVQNAVQGVLGGLDAIQDGINALKGRDLVIGVRVTVEEFSAANSDSGFNARAAERATGTGEAIDSAGIALGNALAGIKDKVSKIGAGGGGGSSGGGGGGSGGAAKDAAAAAKKAAKAAADAAFKAGKKQITASKFIDSITGDKSGIDTALDKLYESLKAANKDKAAALVKELNKDLTKLAGKRDAVSIKLDNAKKALSEIKQESKDYSASIKSAILDTGNVANNNTITFTGVRNSMRAAVRQAREFKDAIAALTKAGLNKNNLGQIIDAGPEAGLAAAKAIQQGGKAGIAELNDLNKQLTWVGTKTGSDTAKTFYDAGVQAAQGLVNGLQSQEKALQKQMDKLALGMVKALKKELKIKSPSQVFEGLGNYVGQGLARGVNASRAGVAASGRNLGASVVFGAGSVLVNGVSDPTAARTSGMLVGGAAADSIARSRELQALAGTG